MRPEAKPCATGSWWSHARVTSSGSASAKTGFSPDRVNEMISSQMDLKEKMKRAQHVVWNNGDADLLRRQTETLGRPLAEPAGDFLRQGFRVAARQAALKRFHGRTEIN